MIAPSTFQFLNDLAANNDRVWFQANKDRYEEARADFEAFITDLIFGISTFDPAIGDLQAKKCIFRIYRDTRFSKNKMPYKTNMGAHLVAFNEKPHDRAGYYIHLESGNVFLAGGAYMPPAKWLNAIRARIDVKGDEFVKIMNEPQFKKFFGEMEGEQLKTKPRDYDENHPHIDLLRYKSFIAMHRLTEKDAQSPNFLTHSVEVFKALKYFDDFLNKALDS